MRDAYLEWIKLYCNNSNLVDTLMISVVIDKLIEHDKHTGVQSESLGDYSVSYEVDYPQSILRLLIPYRKVKVI